MDAPDKYSHRLPSQNSRRIFGPDTQPICLMRPGPVLSGIAAVVLCAACSPRGVPAQSPGAGTEHPALLVLITVDQFRGDYLDRFGAQFTGGLKRFKTESALFPHAIQDHAITETAPGHSTLLSGREPAHTEIIDNEHGVPDPGMPLIGGINGPGASPRRFVGTELFDWMRAADSKARVLSVSRKDRGAILPVGRAKGDVYWFGAGGFTTSKYYADKLPAWVQKFDEEMRFDHLAGTQWDLLLPRDQYPEPDTVWAENGGADFIFPHILPSADALRLRIPAYPWMDSVTLAFALDGVHALDLGKRALQASPSSNTMPDLLTISLSTTDAIGHAFGPDSRELHDQILRVDRWLGQFLDSLQRQVPANRMVVVLTGDHGVSPIPEATEGGGPGGRVWLGDIADSVEVALERKHHVQFDVYFGNGLFFGDLATLKDRRVNVDSLSDAILAAAMKRDGVRVGFTRRTLPTSDDSGAVRWRRTIPANFGWLTAMVAKPDFVWSDRIIAEHGAPNPQSMSIPIAFMGPGISTGRYDRQVRSVDIAPTLATLLGIKPSERLDGATIPEALADKSKAAENK